MKIAVCFAKDTDDCQSVAEKMAQAQKLYDSQTPGSFPLPEGCLAYVTTSERFSKTKLLRQSDTGNLLMISGLPIDLNEDLDVRLQEVLVADYRQASNLIQQLDGAYAAIFWDNLNKKLVVVTDILGMQPLYIARQPGRLLLATELKAFPASGLIPVEMDPAGWGSFISLEFNVGNRTQLANVKCVEPASVLVYDPVSDVLESSVYWLWPEPKANIKLADVDTGQMTQILRREIKGYANHCSNGTILLSGGFDSRLILSMLCRDHIDVHALSMSHRDEYFGIDGKLAYKLAQQMKLKKIDLIEPDSNFYASASYLRYLVMNEVAIPSLNLFIAQLCEHINPTRKAVWEGIAPGFGFAPAYPQPGGFDVYLQDRCIPRESLKWQAVFSIFASPLAQNLYDDFHQNLELEIAKYPDDEFGVARFQMQNQMAHRMALSPFKVLANKVLPFTPGLSKSYWNMAVGLPLRILSGSNLYLEVFRRHFPEALKLPICSGSKLLNTNSLDPRFWMLKKSSQWYKKSQYYFRRLNKLPIVGTSLQRLTGSLSTGRNNKIIDCVIQAVDPDHPDLNAEFVAPLVKQNPPYGWPAQLARSTLFYWQTWQWIMEGRLNMSNAETFLE